MTILIVLIMGFLLDMLFGDPRFLPHPICLIGSGISKGEKIFRKMKNEFIGGTLLSIAIISLSFAIPFFLLRLLESINFYLGLIVQIFLGYQIFAAKSLKTESMKVYYPLIDGDLPLARKNLSYIVGRDTENLDGIQIAKAAVETVAENTTDGVVAPMIFMALGGVPLALMYKAINTLDSMIGYRNEKYLYFGKFAARLDDAANFIPARVSAVFMIASAFLLRLDARNAVKIFLRDRFNHKSPNSAQTESVCAGALNIQLAGDASYFGQLYRKPTIGDHNREIVPEDIKLANKLMYGTAIIGLIAVCLLRLLMI
jgi:adenosylcobinamide-phosphate synthase